jgi:hypothetical protein
MQDLIMKYVKYLLEGLAIAVAAYVIPQKKTNVKDVAKIALVGAITFAVLDMFAPAVSSGARTGAGFGIGAQHVGFLEGMENSEEEGFESENENENRNEFEGFHSQEEENFQNHDDEDEDTFEVEGFKI